MSLDYFYDTFAAVLKKLKASYCIYTAFVWKQQWDCNGMTVSKCKHLNSDWTIPI